MKELKEKATVNATFNSFSGCFISLVSSVRMKAGANENTIAPSALKKVSNVKNHRV